VAELSAVDIQVTITKMVKLLHDIKNEYKDSVIYGAGSAESTLALLQSLFMISYIVKIDPPITFSKTDDIQNIQGAKIVFGDYILQFPDINLPTHNSDKDPLKINALYDYITITLK
jgi:hypothetical protein